MSYIVKQPIAGFEGVKEVSIENNDGITCLLKSLNDDVYMEIPLVCANSNNSFTVSENIKSLLELDSDTKCSVYFPAIIDVNIENSVINLETPFLFNEEKNTVAQCILEQE